MDDHAKDFYRALSLLNSQLVLVFILFLVNGLDLSFLLKFGFLPVFVVLCALKIYVMSALAGGLLEIISGEELVFQWRRLHRNAVALAPGFLAALVMTGLLDFLLFTVFKDRWYAWRPIYFDAATAVMAYVLAQWVMDKKYIRPLGILRRRLNINLSFLAVIVSACVLEWGLTKALGLVNTGGFYWRNIFAFLLNGIHAFEFIFCSFFILGHYPEIREKYNAAKEIFLINPMAAEVIQSLTLWFLRLHPPFFVVLKALTPTGYKFREFNQVVWRERYYKSKALVCITCFTSNCYEAYKIAKEFKKRGSTVVMGGPHVSFLPQEALSFCDTVIIGQAEGVWAQVIRDYEKGEIKPQYSGPASEDDYARVQEELLNEPPYIIKDFLETMRGCKFRCHFCSVPALSGGQINRRPIDAFVELIKKVRPHYAHVTFIDNNIYSDPAYAKELFLALKAVNIKWHSQCTIDIAKNKETLTLARESGCSGLLFGYEVSGESFEKKQGGKFGMAQKYKEYTTIVKKEGIGIKGHFIFGFDSDTVRSLFSLWKFCFSLMPQFAVLSVLTPLPGSGVYHDALSQQRIINLNWRSYSLIRMVVRHPHLDPRWVSALFPAIRTLFLLTASWAGLMFLAVILFFPRYGLVDGFLR